MADELQHELPDGVVRAWRDESGISHVSWQPHDGDEQTFGPADPDLPPDFPVGGSLDDLGRWAVDRFSTAEDKD